MKTGRFRAYFIDTLFGRGVREKLESMEVSYEKNH